MGKYLLILVLTVLLLFPLNCSKPQNNNASCDIKNKTKKLGEISDIFKFAEIVMDDSNIYLWDKFLCKVRIYSKKDLKKIYEFGQKGEGPAEFNSIQNVSVTDNYIYVSSFPKLCCFSKDGKFIKEIKGRTLTGSYVPIGKNFIGKRDIYTDPKSKKNKIAYVLFDANLIKIKDIFETEYMKEFYEVNNSKTRLLWFKDCYKGVVYKDRFYVGSTDRGFFFAIFDDEGNKLYEINKKYERIRVSNEFKETLFNKINKAQNMDGFRRFMAKREIIFPEHFPAYSNFAVDNDRIYVFKYPTHLLRSDSFKKDTLEVLILDLKGNTIGQKSLPASFWNGFQADSIYFHNGKLYLIQLNEKNENLDFFEVSL
jgi:hypothetical protein